MPKKKMTLKEFAERYEETAKPKANAALYHTKYQAYTSLQCCGRRR